MSAPTSEVDDRLRELELENAALFDGASVGYLTLADDDRILRANRAAAELLGVALPSLPGLSLESFLERLDAPALRSFCTRARQGLGGGGCDIALGGNATAMRVVHFESATLPGESCCRLALTDVSAQRLANDALQRSETRLRSAYRRLAQAQESERVRLTGQLHDQVGRNLTALGLHLALLERDIGEGAPAASLREATGLLQATVAQVRHLMSELYPPMLGDYGLFAAVRWWASEVARRSGVEIRMLDADSGWRLRPEVEAAAFRIAQEALENALRHAAPTRIEIALRAHDRRVEMVVADDGKGFDAATLEDDRSSWGLTFMRERALAVGAQLAIESQPGRGTRVRLDIERSPL